MSLFFNPVAYIKYYITITELELHDHEESDEEQMAIKLLKPLMSGY